MSDPSSTTSLLTDLAGALSRRGVAWYVFGAQAVIVWGRPRLTADVDVTVQVAGEDLTGLIGELSNSGFHLRVEDAAEMVRRSRVLPFVHTPTGIPLDMVLAGPGLEEVFLQRAREVDLAGTRVPVICPEDLVITKILAGRPKDIDDVQSVLRAQAATLDLGWIRRTLGMLEEALGQSDLLPALEAELARLRR